MTHWILAHFGGRDPPTVTGRHFAHFGERIYSPISYKLMELLYDIESTGLLRQNSQIHCIVVRNLADDESPPLVFDTVKNNVDEGVKLLESADLLVGHNIISYDEALLYELYPNFNPPKKVLDTLVLSRLYYATLADKDFTRSPYGLPKRLYGSHSLEAWGIRLGEEKGDFGKQNDWSTYSDAMLQYCIQDTTTNIRLYRLMQRRMEAGK